MRFFRRPPRRDHASSDPAPAHTEPAQTEPEPERRPALAEPSALADAPPVLTEPPPPPAQEIKVSRTLVKSQPELEEIVASDPRFAVAGLDVSMAERGFGTLVTISAGPAAGLNEDQLAEALAELSEPQRRPFTNT